MTEHEELKPWLGYCDKCNGPVQATTKIAMCIDYLCYALALALPTTWTLKLFGGEILARAGSHAFGCTCWPKITEAMEQAS